MILAVLGLLVAPQLRADGLDMVDGPNVRVKQHEDGRKSVFTRSPDGKVVTKKTYSASGRLTLVTIYRLDGNGNPRASEIYDAQKTQLYKVDYGYRKEDGQLVMERMWDCRVRRVWKNNPAVEMPVQIVEYLIDPQGKASKPVTRNYLEDKLQGGKFERDYGSPTSAMDPKMFDEPVPATERRTPPAK